MNELRDMVEALRLRACEIRQTKSHIAVVKDGKRVATLPTSPSEYRSLVNARLQLERAGLLEPVRAESGAKRGKKPEARVKPYMGPRLPSGRIPRRNDPE